ncbi:MAG: hypothetical protein J5J06_12635 [Phycisphaerae bacterium]|nr:hypothetical protein [Phycisphaerae bacterium]
MSRVQGIRDRIEDARVLLKASRCDGAFVLALVAVAGLSRIRYPGTTPQRVYFDKLLDYHPDQHANTKDRRAKVDESRKMKDGQAFKCMILDLISDVIVPNPQPGRFAPRENIRIPFGKSRILTNIEELFYKAFRNSFIHEGRLTDDAYLTAPTIEGEVLRLNDPTGIPVRWIPNLLAALAKAPELG